MSVKRMLLGKVSKNDIFRAFIDEFAIFLAPNPTKLLQFEVKKKKLKINFFKGQKKGFQSLI